MSSIINNRFIKFIELTKIETKESYRGIAKRIGITPQYLSNVMNGKPVSDQTIDKLIAEYPSARGYIFGTDAAALKKTKYFLITMIDGSDSEEQYPYQLSSGNSDEYVAYQVHDDLMETRTDLSIRNGDIVICRNVPRDAWPNLWTKRYYLIKHKTLGYICRYLESIKKGFLTLGTANDLFSHESKVDIEHVQEIYLVQDLHTKRFKNIT